jgi:hypothetical protein
MPRPIEAILADISSAKAAGEKPMGALLRRLRAELKEAEGTAAAPASPVPAEPAPSETATDRGPLWTADFALSTASPLDSDEWRFIEKCAAELASRTDGMSTGRVKKAYNDLELKVRLWRIAREIVQEVGIGAEWPQWTALDRDESTGKKRDKKTAAAPAPAPQPEVAAPLPAAGVSVAEVALAAASGAPSTADLARSIAAEIAGTMRTRAMPQGTPGALAGATA